MKPKASRAQAERERVDARNRRIQAAPIKPPASGTFGKGVPDAERKPRRKDKR